jgi:hypothetical protein
VILCSWLEARWIQRTLTPPSSARARTFDEWAACLTAVADGDFGRTRRLAAAFRVRRQAEIASAEAIRPSADVPLAPVEALRLRGRRVILGLCAALAVIALLHPRPGSFWSLDDPFLRFAGMNSFPVSGWEQTAVMLVIAAAAAATVGLGSRG